jgi:hypothetical protein
MRGPVHAPLERCAGHDAVHKGTSHADVPWTACAARVADLPFGHGHFGRFSGNVQISPVAL